VNLELVDRRELVDHKDPEESLAYQDPLERKADRAPQAETVPMEKRDHL